MTRLLFGDLLWTEIKELVKTSHRTKAAIAYVTESLALKNGDELVVDASNGMIQSGQTSAEVLSAFVQKGVLLYSHKSLHAKVIIADSVVIASSANLSENSHSKLFEAGIETDNPNTVSSAAGMIALLIKKSVLIDERFIARILKIEVVKRQFTGGRSKARTTARGHRDSLTWLLGVNGEYEPKDSKEQDTIEREEKEAENNKLNPTSKTAWIRCRRSVYNIREARRGDSVVLIDENRVYRAAAILCVKKRSDCTRIHYEVVQSYKRGSLAWSEFKMLAKKVDLRVSSQYSARRLTEKTSVGLDYYWKHGRGK
jgi:phosphatidylserine/phosphatidylglycerophosphate/cardiolipin synthase-like enzyme